MTAYVNKILPVLALVAIMVSIPGKANAATYVVDPSAGSDSNAAGPFKTIKKGAGILKAGDILRVKAGTYAENLENVIPSGTGWTAPVTIQAYDPAARPLIKPSSGTRVLYFSSGQYIVIDGFVIDAVNVSSDAVKITGSANHIRIKDSEIMHTNTQGILATPGGTGGGGYNEFIRLKIHDLGLEPTGSYASSKFFHGIYISTANNLVEGCEIYNIGGYGIHIYNESSAVADNNVVRNNLIHEVGKSGISGAGVILSSGKNNIAYNNIVWGSFGGITINYGASGSKVYNNTLYGNKEYGIYLGDNHSGTILKNNIAFSNKSNITLGGTGYTSTANLTTDPSVINVASRDFRLKAGSPAINAGETVAEVQSDFYGTARPQGSKYDIGAVEYGSSSPPPTNSPSSDPTSPPATSQPTSLPTAVTTPSECTKPADANCDNAVDGVDYVVWLNNFGKSLTGKASGDFSNNGKVDIIDFEVWRNAAM